MSLGRKAVLLGGQVTASAGKRLRFSYFRTNLGRPRIREEDYVQNKPLVERFIPTFCRRLRETTADAEALRSFLSSAEPTLGVELLRLVAQLEM